MSYSTEKLRLHTIATTRERMRTTVAQAARRKHIENCPSCQAQMSVMQTSHGSPFNGLVALLNAAQDEPKPDPQLGDKDILQ